MTDQFQFNRADFDKALEPIKDLQGRTTNNNANYHTDKIQKTTSSSVKNYQTMIGDVKKRLSDYGAILAEDIEMFKALGADMEEWDAALGSEYTAAQ